MQEGTLEFDRGGTASVSTVLVGDGSAKTAVLSLPRSSTSGVFWTSAVVLAVDGPNASLVLGANHREGAARLVVDHGGRVTGPASASVSASIVDLRDGSIDVKVTNRRVEKTTEGTATLNGTNTYTGGTNVHAGTLRVKRLHENNPVNITGGKLQVMESSPTLPAHPSGDNAFVSRPSSLTIANNGAALGARTYNGQLDLTNNDLILDYSRRQPAGRDRRHGPRRLQRGRLAGQRHHQLHRQRQPQFRHRASPTTRGS